MSRLVQVSLALLTVLLLSAGAYAVGSVASYDRPPPLRDIGVDDVAATPSAPTGSVTATPTAPTVTPSATPTPTPAPTPPPADDVTAVTPGPARVDRVPPRPRATAGDDDGDDDRRGRGRGGDGDRDDDADDGDDDGDDDD